MATPRERADARIWDRVQKDGPNGCWIWTGMRTDEGYGRVKRDGRRLAAHRYIYEMLVGPVPRELVMDHLCRNTSCVNPEHLEPVTNRVNVIDRAVGPVAHAIRTNRCHRGHDFTPENTAPLPNNRRGCRKCTVIYNRTAYLKRQALKAFASAS